MGCVVLLDHLDTRAAVLGDLVDIGTFHQAQTDICMPEAVRGPRLAFAIEAKLLLVEDRFKELALPLRED